jgi:hypothetical protein
MLTSWVVGRFIGAYCPAAGLKNNQDYNCSDKISCFHFIEDYGSNITSRHRKQEDKPLLKFPEIQRVNSQLHSENLLANKILFA